MRFRTSGLSWLVFSEEDIHEARRFIDDLDTGDSTVDTLGFGRVLAEVSEILFPATTTLHRRLRYQIFVPALVWRIQRQRRVSDARLLLKQGEYALQSALIDSGETEGVIGRNRRDALKYWPSLLYWNATNKLQMFGKDPFSMEEVFGMLKEFGDHLVNDDKEDESQYSAAGSKTLSFDAEFQAIAESLFVKDSGKLHAPVTFELTKPEARYLKEKFQGLFPSSLTRHLLDKPASFIERQKSLFKLTTTRNTELNELVRQAERFSQFAMGATYAYRWVLCEHLRTQAKDNMDLEKRYATSRGHAEAHFSRWRKETRDLRGWKYSDLVSVASSFEVALVDDPLAAFEAEFTEASASGRSDVAVLESLRKPIRAREREIKRNSSRFENPNILIPKNVSSEDYGGSALFDYRWERVGKPNAFEIVKRIEGKP